MEYGIFGQLATEEREEGTVVDVETNIVDEIAAEEAYADALAIEADIEKDLTVLAQAEAAVVSLESQIAREEALIVTPEKVTASIVAMSNEALASTATLLGAPIEAISGCIVSQEAAESNPVTGLQVATEGVKEFLITLGNKIKAIFAKIINAFKKLIVKIQLAFNGSAKKAEQLLAEFKKVENETPSELEDKEKLKLGKLFLTGLRIDKNKKLSGVAVNKYISSYNRETSKGNAKAFNILAAVVEKIMTIGSDDAKIKELYESTVATAKSAHDDDYGEISSDGVIRSICEIGNAGVDVQALCISMSEVKDEDYKKALLSLRFFTTSVGGMGSNKFEAKDVDVIIAEPKDINGLLKSISGENKSVKKFAENAMKKIEDSEKAIGELTKKASDDEFAGKMGANAMRSLQGVSTGAYLKSVTNYIKLVKISLVYASMNVSKYKKVAK